jgi:uncharacterized protein (DUF849 family)
MMGVKYGMPASTEGLVFARSLLPGGCEWAAFGASRMAFPMLAQAFLLGGHCRIGMEDTVYLAKGHKTPGNGALVEKAARSTARPASRGSTAGWRRCVHRTTAAACSVHKAGRKRRRRPRRFGRLETSTAGLR